jgi:histidine triad (HIT) family protein
MAEARQPRRAGDRAAFTERGSTKPCAFCSIVGGEAQAFEVYRDDDVVAFLDTHPVFRGHTLLVPVQHVSTYDQLPAALAPAWLRDSQRLQVAVERAMQSDGSLLIVNNVVSQSVPHVHLHVIPRSRGDGLRFWLGPRTRYEDDADARAVAARIAEEWRAQED